MNNKTQELEDELTQSNIIEGNILILEYMGYEVRRQGIDYAIYYDNKWRGSFVVHGYYFMESWDNLISVIKKLQNESLQDEKVFNLLDIVYDSLLTLDIKSTWNSVVLVIKQLNEYKQIPNE